MESGAIKAALYFYSESASGQQTQLYKTTDRLHLPDFIEAHKMAIGQIFELNNIGKFKIKEIDFSLRTKPESYTTDGYEGIYYHFDVLIKVNCQRI